jgi:hypothetical protein
VTTPSSKPAAKRTTGTATKRTTGTATKRTTKPSAVTATEPAPKPVTEPASKPAAVTVVNPIAQPETVPAITPAVQIPAKPITEPASKPAAVTAVNPITQPLPVPAVTPAVEIPAPQAHKSQGQVVSSLQQGQQLLMDAAQTWGNVFSALPVMDLSRIPGLADVPDMQAVTNFAFDIAGDLLSTQREFALELTKVLLPTTTV